MIWANSVFQTTFTYQAEAGITTDLTGWAGTMPVSLIKGGPVVYTFTTGAGNLILGGASGVITLFASAITTATFATWGGGGLYGLYLTDPAVGSPELVLWGGLRIKSL